MPTDKTLRSFLRVEQKLSDSERRIKNPFVFCVPVKAAGDKSAKSSAATLLESLPATLAARAATAIFISEQKDSAPTIELMEKSPTQKT